MKFRLEALKNLAAVVKELANGLKRLRFDNNFVSFTKTVTIANGAEATIRNELQIIPSGYIIHKQTGNGLLTSETDWTKDYVYLTNNGSVEVTATVIFFQ
jgi:hypothetical protein